MNPQSEKETKTPPTTRSVAVAGGLAAAAVGTLAVFAAGGWLVVGAIAAGTAVTGYTVHRIRHPRSRPGVLSSLLLRPSRPKTSGSKLTWPFTGSHRGSAGIGRKAGTGAGIRSPFSRGISGTRSTGSGRKTPGLGTLASSSKPGAGRRAITGGTTRRTPTLTQARPIAKLSARPKTGKPAGTRPPRTGTLTGSKPRARAVSRPSGPLVRPSSHRPMGASHRRPKLGSGSLIQGGRKLGNPLGRTRLGKTKGGLGALQRAKRLGTPGAVRKPNRAPGRSARRPLPYRRPTAGRLVRDGLGLPSRPKVRPTTPSQRRLTGVRRRPSAPFRRPTKAQRARARRTLRLRALTQAWSVRKLPGRAWDRFWARLPQQPLSEWLIPTITPKLSAPAGYRSPEPIITSPVPLTARRAPKVTAPLEAVSDAFAQLANFTPETPEQMEMLLNDISEMLISASGSFTTLADRMSSELPIAQAVGDTLRDLGAGILSMQGAAQASAQTLRQEHEADFARRENPRTNEQWWDTGNH